MRISIFCFVLAIFLLGCSSDPLRARLAMNVMDEFSQQMKTKKKLTMIGIGKGEALPGLLKSLCLSFVISKNIDLVEARILFMSCCEELLEKVNQNEKIRPWLTNYPFTGKNLELMISFRDGHNHTRALPPNIAFICLTKGSLFYCIYENDNLKDVHNETYEEALKIYQESCQNNHMNP